MIAVDFETFAGLVRQRSGLVVSPDKAFLFESRLTPLLGNWGMDTLTQLADAVRLKRDEILLRQVAEAMTTNESFFFRDQKQFDLLRTSVFPAFAKTRARKKLRIWSAACSSGQESYSIAMLWADLAAQYPGWEIEIVGTDFSAAMVKRAQEAVFTQFEVQRGLPVTHLVKYFAKTPDDQWHINDNIRRMTEFRDGNLSSGIHPAGIFDVIFCRNVLIYFDTPTKSRVLNQLASHLAPDGAMFLGGAENMLGLSDRFCVPAGERGLYRLSPGYIQRAG